MHKLFTDGSYNVALKAASIGGYLLSPTGETVFEFSTLIDDPALFEHHEALALEYGLWQCLEMKIKNVACHTDKQELALGLAQSPSYIETRYKKDTIKNKIMKDLYSLLPFFDEVELKWVPRGENARADSLSRAYQRTQAVSASNTAQGKVDKETPHKAKATDRDGAVLDAAGIEKLKENIKSSFLHYHNTEKDKVSIFKILKLSTTTYYKFDFNGKNQKGALVTKVEFNPYIGKIVSTDVIFKNEDLITVPQQMAVVRDVVKNAPETKFGIMIKQTFNGTSIMQQLSRKITTKKGRKFVDELEQVAQNKHILLFNNPAIFHLLSPPKLDAMKNCVDSCLEKLRSIVKADIDLAREPLNTAGASSARVMTGG